MLPNDETFDMLDIGKANLVNNLVFDDVPSLCTNFQV